MQQTTGDENGVFIAKSGPTEKTRCQEEVQNIGPVKNNFQRNMRPARV